MKNYVDRSMTFLDYLTLIDGLLAEGKTTGTNQSEAMVGYGRLNRQRMNRLEKTLELEPVVRSTIAAAQRRQIWLILTEGWCGDAAQNIPVIEKVAAENAKIETRYILRDENLELMDRFLTNSARAIPKVIALDADTLEVLWSWGARPQVAQELFYKMKADGVDKADILEVMQRWYNEDKGRAVANEIAELVEAHDTAPAGRVEQNAAQAA